MPYRAKVAFAVGLLLSVTALATGCGTTIEGNPVASSGSPTEPSFPTSRPTRPPSTTSPPSSTPSAPPTTQRPGGTTLTPDETGYVFIETKSGKTRCQISEADVSCETDFDSPPEQNGVPANGVNITADGAMTFVVGNLGDIPAITLDYQTYRALGWTIEAGTDGTRFTNDGSGHGMFLNTSGLEVF